MFLDYIYMLLFVIWMFGGIEFFQWWLSKTGIESYSKLFIVTVLSGPIVMIVNSILILVFLCNEFYDKRKYSSE